jgi:hypothetical protein
METFRKSVVGSPRDSIHLTSTDNVRRVACAVIHLSESTEVFLEKVSFPPGFVAA